MLRRDRGGGGGAERNEGEKQDKEGSQGRTSEKQRHKEQTEQRSSCGSDASISQLAHISEPGSVLSRAALIGSNCVGLK